VQRNRSARIAVLGSPVPRSRPPGYSSRSATALRRRIVAGALVFVSIVLITIYFREPAGGGLHGVQSAGAAVLRPFEVGAERVARPFRDAYGWFAGLFHAKSQNTDLRAQVHKLSSIVIQNQNAAQENAELKRMLHYVSSPDFPNGYRYVATGILSRPPNEFQQQVGIDAGSTSGIRQDDPVVNADGLVGLVTKVARDNAEVTLLTDPSLKVSAMDLTTKATGIVGHGQGRGTLILDRVSKTQMISPNDWIVTQHWRYGPLTSLYPQGIPIGVVAGASQNDVDLYWQIQLRPRVDFGSLRSVLVLIPKTRR
jgi:rod shape-determining protein MreC